MVEKKNKIDPLLIKVNTNINILIKKHNILITKVNKMESCLIASITVILISALILGFLFVGYSRLEDKLDGYEEICFNWETKEKHILISPISDSIFCIKKTHFGCESGLCYVEKSYRHCIPTKYENGIFTEYNYSNEPLEGYIYTFEEKICNETILKKTN